MTRIMLMIDVYEKSSNCYGICLQDMTCDLLMILQLKKLKIKTWTMFEKEQAK